MLKYNMHLFPWDDPCLTLSSVLTGFQINMKHVHVFDISVSIEWIRNGRQLVSIVLSVGCFSKIDKNNWIDISMLDDRTSNRIVKILGNNGSFFVWNQLIHAGINAYIIVFPIITFPACMEYLQVYVYLHVYILYATPVVKSFTNHRD